MITPFFLLECGGFQGHRALDYDDGLMIPIVTFHPEFLRISSAVQ